MHETYMNTGQVVLYLAARGTPKSYQTVDNWIRKGITVGGAEPIRLRTRTVGGSRLTTKAWVEEFFAEINEAKDAHQDARRRRASQLVSPAAQNRRQQAAQRKLEAADAR